MTMTITPTVDIPLLRKELEFVTAHREKWDQGNWARQAECGTAACIAGWTVIHAGYELTWEDDSVCGCGHDHGFRAECIKDGRLIGSVARELLGLTKYQAKVLFSMWNSLVDLWVIAGQITGGEIQIPAELAEPAEGSDLPVGAVHFSPYAEVPF